MFSQRAGGYLPILRRIQRDYTREQLCWRCEGGVVRFESSAREGSAEGFERYFYVGRVSDVELGEG